MTPAFVSLSPSLVTLVFIILLPLLPAYLLFKLLPSAAIVSGPLQGLQINLGGAFAGYFAVVILVISTHPVWAPPSTYQVWEVNGQVTDENGTAFQLLDPSDVKLSPPTFQTKPGGAFRLTFATTSTPAGGGIEYPDLSIGHTDFESVTIPLEPSSLKDLVKTFGVVTDEGTQRITLKHIVLRKSPLNPYSAAGRAPTAIPASQEHP